MFVVLVTNATLSLRLLGTNMHTLLFKEDGIDGQLPIEPSKVRGRDDRHHAFGTVGNPSRTRERPLSWAWHGLPSAVRWFRGRGRGHCCRHCHRHLSAVHGINYCCVRTVTC